MNCLQFALSFWKDNPRYRLLYNSDHVINVPIGTDVAGFLELNDFGIDYFLSAFKESLSSEDICLLQEYFELSS